MEYGQDQHWKLSSKWHCGRSLQGQTSQTTVLSHEALLLVPKNSTPRIPASYLVLGRWGFQVNFGSHNFMYLRLVSTSLCRQG